MLTAMLRSAVEADPSKTAIVQGSRRIRYGELDVLAGQCAAGLHQLGVGPAIVWPWRCRTVRSWLQASLPARGCVR